MNNLEGKMQCQNCKQETAGIKINNKLFCTNCGEPLGINVAPEEPTTTPQTIPGSQAINRPITPVPKIIPTKDDVDYKKIVDDELREINILEAEEELLEVLEETPQPRVEITSEEKPKEKIPKTKKKPGRPKKQPIIKHNRVRAGGFTMVPGEPNPITEPELPIPHDDMLEVAKEEIVAADDAPVSVNFATEEEEKEENFPLTSKEEKETITTKKHTKDAALRGFFKSGVVEVSKKKKKQKKKPMKLSKKLLIIVPIIVVIFGVGLVLYVNYYGNNAEKAIERSESTTNFDYKKPTYLPPGYEPSYLTTAEDSYIVYLYWYTPDKEKTITFEASNGEWTDTKIQTEIISGTKEQYSQKNIEDSKIWLIGDYALYFAKDNVLYQITASDTISSEELIKIAEGMIK